MLARSATVPEHSFGGVFVHRPIFFPLFFVFLPFLTCFLTFQRKPLSAKPLGEKAQETSTVARGSGEQQWVAVSGRRK